MSYREYYVYVVDLDKSIFGDKKKFREENPQYIPGKPCVYVGQTSRTPIERFESHKRGHKAGKGFVRDYGRYLKKRRIPDQNPHSTRSSALRREKQLAEILKKRGWAVWWN